MACSSGTSSGSSQLILQSVGSEKDSQQQQQMMDQRKRKRMISNRESARRSRMKKQKHLDDLTAQVSQLRAENNHILTNLSLVTRLCVNVEAENSVLMAQIAELNHRLQSLNEILNYMSPGNSQIPDYDVLNIGDDDFLNPWNLLHLNHPLMASPNAFVEY